MATDDLRKHNLSAILTLLHHGGSQARSALTAQTGLNRSTVAALVAELEQRRLVYETEPDPTNQVGRPSPRVNVDESNVAIAINPEVDAITVGVVALGGRVVQRIRHDTDRVPTARDAVEISARIIRDLEPYLTRHGRIVGLGVAVPGLVRAADGLVRWGPHLEWTDEPVGAMLAETTGHDVVVGNDASLAAMVEHIYGAGRGLREMVYFNGSPSGIGGGVVVGGALLEGASGYAGELGHTRNRGVDLEVRVNRGDLLAALGLTSASPDELELRLLADTSARVAKVVHAQLDHLGAAIADAVNILNPQRVVLGGFLASILEKDASYLRDRVAAEALAAPFEDVEIVPAALGSDLLMIGAAELTFQGLLADPAGYGQAAARR
ncbi:MAG: ROK family protein [Schumannella sp.]|nr:ROK family protein [Microbacteriaceae bacterium]